MTHRHLAAQRQWPTVQRGTGPRSSAGSAPLDDEAERLLRLQHGAGNAAVASLLASGRSVPGDSPVPVQRDDPGVPAGADGQAAGAPAPTPAAGAEGSTQASATRTVAVSQGTIASAATAHTPIGDAARAADTGGSPSPAGATAGSPGAATPAAAPAPTPATPAPTPGTGAAVAEPPRSTLFNGAPVGFDIALGGTANVAAIDSYNPAGGSGPYRPRWGGQPGAGDLSASVGGALVLRGRYAYRAGSWQFLYEPTLGGSVSMTGMTTDDGRVQPAYALAVSASADMLHWGSGAIDLHVLNTSLGLGWNMTTGDVLPQASVSPIGVEWHMLPNVSAMISLPVSVTPDPTSGNANVTFGPQITFTWNARQGGAPGGG